MSMTKKDVFLKKSPRFLRIAIRIANNPNEVPTKLTTDDKSISKEF